NARAKTPVPAPISRTRSSPARAIRSSSRAFRSWFISARRACSSGELPWMYAPWTEGASGMPPVAPPGRRFSRAGSGHTPRGRVPSQDRPRTSAARLILFATFSELTMLRTQLKSKLHLARITDANVDYEGSISIPEDLMQLVDLWPGEMVLVASRDTG